MKLRPAALWEGAEEQIGKDGTVRVRLLRGVADRGRTLRWTCARIGALNLCGCLGAGYFLDLFGWAGWFPVVLLAGIWCYHFFGDGETWELAPSRLELWTTFFGVRRAREVWSDGTRIRVVGPVRGVWSVLLARSAGERCLLRGDTLDDALGLAAYLVDRTGWPVEYAGTVLEQVIEVTLNDRDVPRLTQLVREPAFLPLLALEARQGPLLRLLAAIDAQTPLLRAWLEHGTPNEVVPTLELLAALDDRGAVPAIRRLFEEAPSDAVRAGALDALTQLAEPVSLHLLCQALERGHPLPAAASRALGERGDPESVPALCRLLQFVGLPSDAGARQAAAVALGKLGDQRGLTLLCKALRDPSLAVREAAADALVHLGGARAVPDLCDALRDGEGLVAAHAAAALAAIGAPEAVPALLVAMETGATTTRVAATRAIAAFGPEAEIVRALCDALTDPQAPVRREAAASFRTVAERGLEAAAKLRPAIPTLRRLSAALSSERPEVKRACREALRQIEAGTAGIRDLPLPATSRESASDTLPRPFDPDD